MSAGSGLQATLALLLIAVPLVAAAAPAAARRDAQPRVDTSPAAADNGAALQLDPTQIKGHKGLPRVLYIVPWKRAEALDASGRPEGSLIDEVLAPVDRTEFRRQQRYSDGLQSEAGQ